MSTVDRVQASVMTALLRGNFAPGTRLRQDELADRFGVSKIPVREALHRLAALGVLRFEPNRGAVVPVLSAADAEEIYALRLGVEPVLLARAIPRMTIVDLAEAELALDAGTASIAEANWAFHEPLYRAAGWARGSAMAQILHAAVAPYVLLYTADLATPEQDRAEHFAILTACRDADAEQAARLIRAHLDHARHALIRFLESEETP